jgi:hypothetical protein
MQTGRRCVPGDRLDVFFDTWTRRVRVKSGPACGAGKHELIVVNR